LRAFAQTGGVVSLEVVFDQLNDGSFSGDGRWRDAFALKESALVHRISWNADRDFEFDCEGASLRFQALELKLRAGRALARGLVLYCLALFPHKICGH
jgi:hypothetical protein